MDATTLAGLKQLVEQGSQDWQAYREHHGTRALNSYLFLVNAWKGFPVLVKAESPKQVDLIILQTGAEFSVSTQEFDQHCGGPFLLRPELRDTEPGVFDEYTAWFSRAYCMLGLTDVLRPSKSEQ